MIIFRILCVCVCVCVGGGGGKEEEFFLVFLCAHKAKFFLLFF